MPYLVQQSFTARYCPLVEQVPNFASVRCGIGPSTSLYQYHLSIGDKLPERIVQQSPHKALPDFLHSVGSWIVSQAFKDVAEQVGQSANEFLPIPVFDRKGVPAAQNYYFLDVREIKQAIDFDASSGQWEEHHGSRLFTPLPGFGPGFGFDLAIDVEKVEGVHIWREPEHMQFDFFFSDKLVAAIKKAKLKDLRYTKLRVLET